MTELQNAILQIVRTIPPGRVVSYGQLAAYLGMPRGARVVGWAMSSLDGVDFPWWRVLNNAGKITIRGNRFSDAQQQRALLAAEGVELHDFHLDIEQYRFRPDAAALQTLGIDAGAVGHLIEKYEAKGTGNDQAALC